MLNDYPPVRPNTRGARWNPPGTAALYVSLERASAIAEGDHLLSLQQPPVKVRRKLYTLRVALASVLDLSSSALLAKVGIEDRELRADDLSACQAVGGAASWLGHDGLLVPSARAAGTNLVIFPTLQSPESMLEQVDVEELGL